MSECKIKAITLPDNSVVISGRDFDRLTSLPDCMTKDSVDEIERLWGRAERLQMAVTSLERVIAEAEHERGCPALGVPVSPFDPKNHRRKCGDWNCFKSRVT